MKALKNKIYKERIVFSFLVFYFLSHVIFLTRLPIFNDEAIYLDWAWSYTHIPGHLYDSLLDAKQPLLIWIFAVFENFIPDPLLAGRIVSVIIGAMSVIGIYVLTKIIFSKKVATLAAFLYSITPIFVFFNRQALMEGAMMCIGIWTCTALYNFLDKPSERAGFILGTILGVGFFIKSTTLIFIVLATSILIFYKLIKREKGLGMPYLTHIGMIIGINILLFINPIFWQTFSLNNRTTFSPTEILTFPVIHWANHLLGFVEIGIFFMTPIIFLSGIAGVILLVRRRRKKSYILLIYFLLALFLEIISTKTQSQRYLVPFLPFFVILSSYTLMEIWNKKIYGKILVGTSVLFISVNSLILIINPYFYISKMSQISKYSELPYIESQTSGYSAQQAVSYLKSNTNSLSMIFIAFNIGNPESTMNLYSQRMSNLAVLHIDAKLFPSIENYDCMTSKYPTYFVTRNSELSGMDRFFTLEKTFADSNDAHSVSIYGLRSDCDGESFSLSDMYKVAIEKTLKIKLY